MAHGSSTLVFLILRTGQHAVVSSRPNFEIDPGGLLRLNSVRTGQNLIELDVFHSCRPRKNELFCSVGTAVKIENHFFSGFKDKY